MNDNKGQRLRRAYARVIIPDSDSGTFAAKILEFPGCVAQGDTAADAYANLEVAAEDWITAATDLGQDIPSPYEDMEFSGRVLLRLPRSLHKGASEAAQQDGISLNQFIVAAIAEHVGYARAKADVLDHFEGILNRGFLHLSSLKHRAGNVLDPAAMTYRLKSGNFKTVANTTTPPRSGEKQWLTVNK